MVALVRRGRFSQMRTPGVGGALGLKSSRLLPGGCGLSSGRHGAANRKGAAAENAVAQCDDSEKALYAAEPNCPDAKKYTDFRKLFDHSKSFDAGVVSTCEHTHAYATMLALKHGKHV